MKKRNLFGALAVWVVWPIAFLMSGCGLFTAGGGRVCRIG
jgi:hypothetical protein